MALSLQAPWADSRLDEKQQQIENEGNQCFPFFVSEVVFVEVMCLCVHESLV